MGGSPAGGLAALSGGVFGSVGGVGGPGETGGSSDTVRAVEAGVDLLTNVLKLCPGIVCAYIELARCHMAQGQHEEASRVLHQCLALQPHCSAALVALAKVEVLRMNASAADRSLEQALSCDFSVRSVNLFRLVQATVRAQQGRADEAIKEIEALMALPEIQLGAAHKSLPVEEPDAFRGMGVKGGKGGGSGPVAGSSGSSSSGNGSGKMHTGMLRLTEDDRVSAFIVYASLLSKARRLKEANKVLSEAKMAFAGTAQEVQVLVAASHLAVERKDFDTAIRTLDKIAPDNPTYKRAQMIKAEVYLVYQRDKEKFVNCYNQLVGRDGSPQNFSLLGEAYLRILNPEKAVEALEEAYKMDQSNSRLRARIGRALVATHEYHRAVRFYEDAIREVTKSAKASASNGGPNGGPGGRGGNGGIGGWGSDAGGGASSKGGASASVRSKTSEAVSLSHDLAKLFLKLGKPESSSRVLEGILHNDHRDIFDMRQDVATLLLLVEVHKINAPKEVVDTLLKAKAVQRDLLNQVRSDVTLAASSEVVEAERLALSAICESLGACYVAEGSGSDKDAEAAFRESIQHNPHNVRAMIGLAKIHKRNGEADLCQAQCQKVISAEPSNEEATIMLSELLFATASEPAGAVKPLQTLLQDHPNNYKALANLITLLRKGGQLEEVPAYITAAEKKDRRSASHAGLHFCKGLYARHTNAVGQAISEFNLARRDEAWGHDALVHMIELYLNPDQEGVWQSEEGTGDAGDKESGGGGGGGGGGGSSSSGSVLDEATIGNIQAAEILLKELQPKARDPMRFRVLESYCALASRQKHNVDRAMQTFIDLLETDQDYLPAVLGMATGFMVEKAAHKARNLLKRVAKMEQAHHDGEDFQKATLLLAKFSVDKSKYDLAQELCTKCLATDKSCSQAWEIMALIKEKDQDYAHAADCYEKAWKLEFEAAAAVGFKLAFCYLKSKKYVEAIDVAERVLDQYPDYPRIREEILKKALLGIRSTT
jgi:tetratricopeptide repeat protein 21B